MAAEESSLRRFFARFLEDDFFFFRLFPDDPDSWLEESCLESEDSLP
jgi:hypothetical protein